jgi:multidrug efflux pump subunit AcrB
MAAEDKVVDVDDTVEFAQPRLHFVVDREKAALSGIADAEIAQTLALALGGEKVGTVHVDTDRNPLHIELRLPAEERSSASALASLSVRGRNGGGAPLRAGAFRRENPGADHLPQEPGAGGLRFRRDGGEEPGQRCP